MLEQWIKENANIKDGGSVAVINDDVWILPPRCFSNMPGLKKVDAAKKRGKEYCDLVSSEPYPMRQEHIDYFLKKGYDIYWSVLDLETGPAYYYKAVWTEDAEGKLKEGF